MKVFPAGPVDDNGTASDHPNKILVKPATGFVGPNATIHVHDHLGVTTSGSPADVIVGATNQGPGLSVSGHGMTVNVKSRTTSARHAAHRANMSAAGYHMDSGEAVQLNGGIRAKRMKYNHSPVEPRNRYSSKSPDEELDSIIRTHSNFSKGSFQSVPSFRQAPSGSIRLPPVKLCATQATLHSRSGHVNSLDEGHQYNSFPSHLAPPPPQFGAIFDMSALARNLRPPGTPDSGTSSVDGTPYQFRATPREPRLHRIRQGSVDDYALIDPTPQHKKLKRRVSGGNSCDFGRMMISSNESMDSLYEVVSLKRPSGVRRRKSIGSIGRPRSAPSARRQSLSVVSGLDGLDRPITSGSGSAFQGSLYRRISVSSQDRSDIGSSIIGSRPSTAEIDLDEMDSL